jgi:cyclic beta-1,2-glucan synthetase
LFQPCLPLHWPQAELTMLRDGRSMRFILVRATADAALQAVTNPAAVPEARLLRCGQWLDWPALPAQSCFVIPLLSQTEVK